MKSSIQSTVDDQISNWFGIRTLRLHWVFGSILVPYVTVVHMLLETIRLWTIPQKWPAFIKRHNLQDISDNFGKSWASVADSFKNWFCTLLYVRQKKKRRVKMIRERENLWHEDKENGFANLFALRLEVFTRANKYRLCSFLSALFSSSLIQNLPTPKVGLNG